MAASDDSRLLPQLTRHQGADACNECQWRYAEEIKASWGPGPWQDEPDLVEWEFRGLPCLIVRPVFTGCLCGYVGISPDHRLHGKSINEPEIRALEAHGGVTYADENGPTIFHSNAPKNVWWLGFDCGHGFDVQPALFARLSAVGFDLLTGTGFLPSITYKPIEYVRCEVVRLATQLLELPILEAPRA